MVFLDAGGGQLGIQLRAGAMDDDRGQADVLQERQRRHQRVEVVAQHRAADLDHGEARRVELRSARYWLISLALPMLDSRRTMVCGSAGRARLAG